MKKFTVFSLFIAGVLFFTGVDTLSAGTLSLEGQAWYVMWDSGLAKMNAQIVEAQLQKELAHYGNFCIIKFMQQTTTNRRYGMETIPLYEVIECEVIEITLE